MKNILLLLTAISVCACQGEYTNQVCTEENSVVQDQMVGNYQLWDRGFGGGAMTFDEDLAHYWKIEKDPAVKGSYRLTSSSRDVSIQLCKVGPYFIMEYPARAFDGEEKSWSHSFIKADKDEIATVQVKGFSDEKGVERVFDNSKLTSLEFLTLTSKQKRTDFERVLLRKK